MKVEKALQNLLNHVISDPKISECRKVVKRGVENCRYNFD